MAITIDQASLGENGQDSASTTVLTTTGAVAVGATILVWWSFENPSAQTFTSITSSPALTWDSHEISNDLIGNYVIGYSVAYAQLGFGSSSTITITVSAAAPNLLLFASSFNGVVQSTPIDDDNHAEDSAPPANDAWDGGIITTTQSGDVVAACCFEAQDGSRSSTPASGYTETHQFARGTDDTWTAVYQIVGSAGSYTPGGTWDNASSNGWGAVSVALKEQQLPSTFVLRTVRSNLRW